MTQLFRRKPIAALMSGGDKHLEPVMGAGDLIMLAIGAVIGAGIFGAIGTAAAPATATPNVRRPDRMRKQHTIRHA